MATRLGEAYLALTIRENLAVRMQQVQRKYAEQIRHMQRISDLTPNIDTAKFDERMRHVRATYQNQIKAMKEATSAQLGKSADNLAKGQDRASMDAARLNIRMRRQAAREQEQASVAASRLQIRMTRQAALEQQRALQEQERAAMAASRMQIRMTRQAAQEQARASAQASRLTIRMRRQAEAEAQQQNASNRNVAGISLMGAGAGATAAIVSTVRDLTDAMAGLFMRGMEVNSMLARQQIVLEQLTGSTSVAKNMLIELADLDVRTPFNIMQLGDAARALKATGVVGNTEVLPMVRKLADAAAGSTKGLDSLPHIALAISQMLAKGKIQSEEMTRQLSNAGIPAWKLLADAMGLSVAKVMELSKQGKLGLNEINLLIDAMGKKYEGLAEKVGMSNVTDAFNVLTSRIDLILAEITKPVNAPIIDVIKQMMDVMATDTFKGIVNGMAEVMGMLTQAAVFFATNPFGQALIAITAIATAAGTAAMAVGGIVAGAVLFPEIALGAAIVAGLMVHIATAAAAVSAAFVLVGASFYEAFNSEQGAVIRKNVSEIWKVLVDIANLVGGILLEAFGALADIFNEIFQSDVNIGTWETVTDLVREMLQLFKAQLIVVLQIARALRNMVVAPIRGLMIVLELMRRIAMLDPTGARGQFRRDKAGYDEEMSRANKAGNDAIANGIKAAVEEANKLAKSLYGVGSAASESAASIKDIASGISAVLGAIGNLKDTSKEQLRRKAIEAAEKEVRRQASLYDARRRASGKTQAERDAWEKANPATAYMEAQARLRALQNQNVMDDLKDGAKGGISGLFGKFGGVGKAVGDAGGLIGGLFKRPDAEKAALDKLAEDDKKKTFAEKMKWEYEFRKNFSQGVKNAPQFLQDMMKRNSGLIGLLSSPKKIGGAVAELAKDAGKGVAGVGGAVGGLFGGENAPKAKGGFVGIAELSKRIQEGIINSDEKKDRKAMVKGINGINAGVKQVENVIAGAVKWIGKAL